ncbi:MAG: T9SS type A sorting domain-containing protein, partial [Cyclobacteriaceae bacterium]
KQKRGEHFNNLYQFFRKDTLDPASLDSLELLLANDPYLDSKYRLVFFYYQEQDSTNMNNVLNSIPSSFSLSNSEQAIHQDYLFLFNMLEQLSGNELLIDEAQALQLETLLERDDYFPGAYARDILFAAGFIDYEEPIIIPEAFKSSEFVENEPFNSFDKPEILNVFPNPADDYIVVDYNADGHNGIVLLSIIDLNGKPVFAEVQNMQRNQKVISTQDWKSGIYLVTVSVNGSTIKSRKLTIK